MRKIMMLLFLALTMTATAAFAGGSEGPTRVTGPNSDTIVHPYICTINVAAESFGVYIKNIDPQKLLARVHCKAVDTTPSSTSYTCKMSSETGQKFGQSRSIAVYYAYTKGDSKADVCKWFVHTYDAVK